jgi:ketosteroid isomerase-like protein
VRLQFAQLVYTVARNRCISKIDMTSKTDIIAILDGLADAFNAHDIDKIMAYFDDDCVLDMPRGPKPHGSRYKGLDNVRRGLLTRFETTPDVHYGNVEHFVDGDTGISKWLLTGTALEGQRIQVRGCDFYTLRNGKIIRKDSYWKIVG